MVLIYVRIEQSWWRLQMEAFSALLALFAGNSPVTGEFPSQKPVPRSFDVFFDLHLNKRLSKQSWSWWFATPSRSLWRHCNKFTYAEDIVVLFTILPQLLSVLNTYIVTDFSNEKSAIENRRQFNTFSRASCCQKDKTLVKSWNGKLSTWMAICEESMSHRLIHLSKGL